MKPFSSELMGKIRIIGADARQALADGAPETAQCHLQNAWALVPEPKSDSEDSVTIARGALRLMAFSGMPALALYWIDEINQLGFSEIDAEPDYLMGVTYLELGQPDKAFSHFKKSAEMSGGRCFQGEPPKYKAFYRQHKAEGA